ncbi:selenite/tellurite reduction operon c-type cytochrome ExtM [Trichlorobacter lovleyi]|uniref:selenite/tellurite reduction operon c-type cytochrome ExtM n=1 Tax=Trichlorobacter lovleyi TaxID=313985 RepID=UPI0023EF96B1|nr:selenite/tellurite reduction operon c-type cytochrome ExtM [Trichlorobacter lovleyi]
MHSLPRVIILIWGLLLSAGCSSGTSHPERCLSCHKGIEQTSSSHSGCVACHGGNPAAKSKLEAHRGIYGLSNRSYAGRWESGCGPCHRHQLERMQSSQMFTAAGMIAQTQATWEGERPGIRYGSQAAQLYDTDGKPLKQQDVAQLDNLSGELYRKFCARCHLARHQDPGNGAGNPAGCAACHFPYAAQATYNGGDPTMRGKSPHGSSHAMHALPSLQSCAQCHHRSGRTALSYQGLMDGNNGMVPTRNGQPGPVRGSDLRNFTHIAPDIHYNAGMDCIDCHTSREVMGEGYASASLHGQLEVTCEDCHGSVDRPPRYRAILRENEDPVRESRSYPLQMRPGMEMILTSKGRPFSNVFHVDGNVVVQVKQSGRLLRSKVITGTPEHTVTGHGRLTCTACHSRTVVQCYGCHTQYDREGSQMDFIKGVETPGQFSETEDYRTLYPFPLALNQKGRISPVTPGCQTFVTVVDEQGTVLQNEAIMQYKGKRQLRFAPFHGHNTGRQAVGCAQCHANPAFLGFGQHIVEGRSIKGTLICELSDNKPLDGYLTMHKGQVQAYSAITRANARPLNQQEVQRTLQVNLCLVCHTSAKDPIYRKRINYRDLDDTVHRRLLAPR